MSVKLRDEGDRRHFEVGEPLCLYTTFPVRVCPHCQALPPPTTTLVVTAVDRERGVITFDEWAGE